jgi:DNA recombination protein RmuC
MAIELIIGVILGAGIAVGILLFYQRRNAEISKKKEEELLQTLELKLQSMMPEILNQSSENLVKLANEKLGSEKKEMKTDMENKREEIGRLIDKIEKNLKANQEELQEANKDRVSSFKVLSEKLTEQKKLTEQLRVTTEGLKKVLSNNQLRGQFGEQVAEDLLRMSGFVRGVDYEFNKKQKTTTTRPDFSIFLPDKTVINVDAKFPYNNLQKMTEAENKEQKKEFQKLFERDVKEKIKQVTSRDYINPEENTVDFVILFIPNEMIFSFVYDQMHEVWQDAMSKKVILTGPFSFTAILRMVKQAYDNFKFQSNIREIIGDVKMFVKEFQKFNDAFEKIGDRIQSAEKQFNKVNTTRMNVLRKRMDKVQLIEGDEETEELKLLDDD